MRLTEKQYGKLIDRTKKTITQNYSSSETEDEAQKTVGQYLDSLKQFNLVMDWTHVPNGGKRPYGEAGKLKGLGVKPGFPDLMIFAFLPKFPTAGGIAIEMKRAVVSAGASLEQEYWLTVLKKRGWLTCVCEGADEAIGFLNAIGLKLPGERSLATPLTLELLADRLISNDNQQRHNLIKAWDALQEVIEETLSRKKSVYLPNFGTFTVKSTHMGVKTKKTNKIRNKVHFAFLDHII